METIGKNGIVEAVRNNTNLKKIEIEKALDGILETIKAECNKGNTVMFRGFGTFKTKTAAARIGRNPQTGEAIQIPAKQKFCFKASGN